MVLPQNAIPVWNKVNQRIHRKLLQATQSAKLVDFLIPVPVNQDKILTFHFRSPISRHAIWFTEALRFAVNQINSDTSLLPKVVLGIDLYGLSSCHIEDEMYVNLPALLENSTHNIVGLIGPEMASDTLKLFEHHTYSPVSFTTLYLILTKLLLQGLSDLQQIW